MNKMLRVHIAVCIISFFWLFPIVQSHAHGPVSIVVHEALANDPQKKDFSLIQGVDRKKEPVTFGIPFPFDTYFFELSQFYLLKNNKEIKEVQYRVVQKWPTRRIRWVRIDLLADLKAGVIDKDYLLSSSNIPLSTEKLAKEENGLLLIDTGAAKFWLKKKGFNLFDKVAIAGKEFISPDASVGVEITDQNGKVYSSSRDPNTNVIIEENGHVRAVIRARGTHTSKDGKTFLHFTIRMHFYKGKKRVRIFYTLRNASKKKLENVQFKSVELVLKTNFVQPSFVIRNHDGKTTGKLEQPTAKVDLFQGENNFPTIRGKGFDKKVWPTLIEGYSIKQDGKKLKTGNREQPISLFYAQAKDTDGSFVMAGTRFGAGYWPQGLGINGDGTIRIGVFPKENDKLYTIRFGSHQTHEHVVYFEDKKDENAQDEFIRFQYPLVGKPNDPGWYNAEGMLLWRLISFNQEAEFYNLRGWPTKDRPDATLNRRPSFAVIRHLDRSSDQPIDQFSQGMIHAFNFLREEKLYAGTYYLNAEQRANFNADQGIHRSDDYSNEKVAKEVPALLNAQGTIKSYTELPNADQLPTTSSLWTDKNPHAYGLGFWYFTGGNERLSHAYHDWGETLKRMVKTTPKDLRVLSWQLFNLSDLSVFSGLPEYITAAWKLVDTHFVSQKAEIGQSAGAEPTRGFVLGPSLANQPQPVLQTLTQAGILARALAYFSIYATVDKEQSDRVKSKLEGLVRYSANELWIQKSDKPGEYGLTPTGSPNQSPPTNPAQVKNWNGGIQGGFISLFYGYILTCEQSFFDKAKLLLKASAHNTPNAYWHQDRAGRHMLQDLIQNTKNYYLWHPQKLTSQRLANGDYKLSWSVSEFAWEYWIKYADKKIVPSLGYDPKTKRYKYDPKTHTSFFSAIDAKNEPKPGDVNPGETQSLLISGLDPKKEYHFAARFFSRELCGKTAPPPVKKQETNHSEISSDGGVNSDINPDPPVCGCQTTEGTGFLWLLGFFLFGLVSLPRKKRKKWKV